MKNYPPAKAAFLQFALSFAAGCTTASAGKQTVASRPETDKRIMLPKHSYELKGTHEVSGRQGITTDGQYYYVGGSTGLIKYDKNFKEAAPMTILLKKGTRPESQPYW